MDGHTDKRYKRKVYDVIPFKQKKNFGNLTVRMEIVRRVRNGQTNRRTGRQMHKKCKSYVSDVIPFKQKKNFGNLMVRTEIERGYGQMDGRKEISTISMPYFPFFYFLKLKIGK